MAFDMLQRGFEGNWLGGTFSKAVFVGNGLVAIVAGLLGHALVEILQLGPVSPFDAAALVLLIGGAYIAFSWTENYGESSDHAPFYVSLVNAGKTIWEGMRFGLATSLTANASRRTKLGFCLVYPMANCSGALRKLCGKPDTPCSRKHQIDDSLSQGFDTCQFCDD